MRTKSALHCTKLIVRQLVTFMSGRAGVLFTTPSQQGNSSGWSFTALSSDEPEKTSSCSPLLCRDSSPQDYEQGYHHLLLHCSPF